jgi:hypothetical protein
VCPFLLKWHPSIILKEFFTVHGSVTEQPFYAPISGIVVSFVQLLCYKLPSVVSSLGMLDALWCSATGITPIPTFYIDANLDSICHFDADSDAALIRVMRICAY